MATREQLVDRGRKLEYFTIGWNSLEAIAALVSGLVAGSVALVGFGLDSFIEVTSGVALLWRLHHDRNAASRERAEHLTLRIVGTCFLLLSVIGKRSFLSPLPAKGVPSTSSRRRRNHPSIISIQNISEKNCIVAGRR